MDDSHVLRVLAVDALRVECGAAEFEPPGVAVAENVNGRDACPPLQGLGDLGDTVAARVEHDDFALLMRVEIGLNARNTGIDEDDLRALRWRGGIGQQPVPCSIPWGLGVGRGEEMDVMMRVPVYGGERAIKHNAGFQRKALGQGAERLRRTVHGKPPRIEGK